MTDADMRVSVRVQLRPEKTRAAEATRSQDESVYRVLPPLQRGTNGKLENVFCASLLRYPKRKCFYITNTAYICSLLVTYLPEEIF